MSLDTHPFSPTPGEPGVLSTPARNADVIDAITGHHTALVNTMRNLTAAVVDNARTGRYDQALLALMAEEGPMVWRVRIGRLAPAWGPAFAYERARTRTRRHL